MASIGETLGVRNIIEGSVLRDGNRVRIMVQLIDATKDVQIWAGSFEREITWSPDTEPYNDDPRMHALAEEIGIGHVLDEILARRR